MQWLYGSAEGAAESIQVYHAMVDYVRSAVADRPHDSVVLASDPGDGPAQFVPCGDKPFAAILDVDETAILNLGYEALLAEGRANRQNLIAYQTSGTDKAAPVPGALYAVKAMRQMGVKVIYSTNRDGIAAAGTAQTLDKLGFGPAVHGDTLFLRGDASSNPEKDGRRETLSQRYCVVAMAGDQMGDFADLFNAKGLNIKTRRSMAAHGWAAKMWGNGWFLLPNPTYGPGLRGTMDEVFPPDKRWTPESMGNTAGK
ncbi:HAD family acid phosphatase [Tsuneonella mangrovi]|uniref:HAD family acid phosphatase n=1 Tax=Tsuneonella mangrovi TaxID=1982042 RepID=UPI001F0A587F|nr:HAD family acid phosphatase [Tsuneonella mangrovi]